MLGLMMSLLRKTNNQRALSSPCNPLATRGSGALVALLHEFGRVYTERTA